MQMSIINVTSVTDLHGSEEMFALASSSISWKIACNEIKNNLHCSEEIFASDSSSISWKIACIEIKVSNDQIK